jgi:hypothetical protein
MCLASFPGPTSRPRRPASVHDSDSDCDILSIGSLGIQATLSCWSGMCLMTNATPGAGGHAPIRTSHAASTRTTPRSSAAAPTYVHWLAGTITTDQRACGACALLRWL